MKNIRLVALILSFLLVLGVLASCNSDGDEATDAPDSAVTEEAPTAQPTNASTEAPTNAPVDTPAEAPSDEPADWGECVVFSEDFDKYTVVLDHSSDKRTEALAEGLTDALNCAWGTDMYLEYDSGRDADEYEILIGETDRPESEAFGKTLSDGECGYTVLGNKIVILGSEEKYTERAIVLFVNLVLFGTDTSEQRYMTGESTHVLDVTDMISVMSYNLKVGYANVNADILIRMVKNYMPDLLGVQEADDTWMKALENGLSEYGYEHVGTGRDSNGRGERSAIFYRTDKFEMLYDDTFWLTDTPTEVSKVEGSNCNRIVTVALLTRISDGKFFACANTHLDHSSSEIRSLQAEFLDMHVKSLDVEEFIVTGDFNFQPTSSVYDDMMAMGYENCALLARYERGRNDNTYTGGTVIDYCFRYGGDVFEPYFYAVCDEQINGKTPSDHHPIFLMLELR